ncbi:FliH/SctL family protein [Chitinivibrio alkaliphilus]|uniref:Flagellar assembly protein FliH n=1 Tax=Chitinivibrio alkaliphilus ACht1 TaxID=1313304 RepID=U7D9B8_9BACT|nr:FliH/SctL family protein [Chitinivibrio alkaliphilus]ERP31687.1 flagellar assembly protein FliH [Chitinivibrio alkaliphilus ACht1]
MSDDRKETSRLIDELLQKKDPALVGMKKILKQKRAQRPETSYAPHVPEVFGEFQRDDDDYRISSDTSTDRDSLFDADEEEIIRQEQQILELQDQIEKLQHSVEQTRKVAYEEGVSAGRASAEEEFSHDLSERVGRINEEHAQHMAHALTEQMEDREKQLRSLQRDILNVATLMAEKIVEDSLVKTPDFVYTSIKKSLKYLSGNSRVEIKVSPQEYERVREKLDEFSQKSEYITSVVVSSSEKISPGGCLVETNTGVIDATIEGRLEKNLRSHRGDLS